MEGMAARVVVGCRAQATSTFQAHYLYHVRHITSTAAVAVLVMNLLCLCIPATGQNDDD